jgi:hypothetical protein
MLIRDADDIRTRNAMHLHSHFAGALDSRS